jgi:hypothetical protein
VFANNALRHPDELDLPATVVFSFDPMFDAKLEELPESDVRAWRLWHGSY